MRTLLSTRHEKLFALIDKASKKSSEWLIAALRNTAYRLSPVHLLARLACIRVLLWRGYGRAGLPYFERKRSLRLALGV